MPPLFSRFVLGPLLIGTVIHSAAAQEGGSAVTVDDKGVTLRFLEGRATLNLGGRTYLDIGDGDVSDDAYDIFDKNIDFSQARIELTGTFDEWLTAAYQYDVADDESPLKDVALGAAFVPATVTVGNFKEPFSLDELTSDNDMPFMSRSLANAFSPGRDLGVAFATSGELWTAAAGVYGGDINDSISDGGVGWTGRFTYTPYRNDNDVVHLGASASYRDLDSGGISFSTAPESFLFGTSLVDTGDIEDAQDLLLMSLEAAWQSGPVRARGEYILANVDRDGGDDPMFQGAYALVAWMVNGTGRPYSTKRPAYSTEFARFSGPELEDAQRVSQGGYGLFELAARLSGIDLDDDDIDGGRQVDLTLGVNWYPDKNIRLMANYVRAEVDDAPEVDDDVSADIFQFRVQVAF